MPSRRLKGSIEHERKQHFTRDTRGRVRTEDIKKFNKLFEKIASDEGVITAKKTCNICSRTLENMRTNKTLTIKMATRILNYYNKKYPKIKSQ